MKTRFTYTNEQVRLMLTQGYAVCYREQLRVAAKERGMPILSFTSQGDVLIFLQKKLLS